jgi:hypothetical protein
VRATGSVAEAVKRAQKERSGHQSRRQKLRLGFRPQKFPDGPLGALFINVPKIDGKQWGVQALILRVFRVCAGTMLLDDHFFFVPSS